MLGFPFALHKDWISSDGKSTQACTVKVLAQAVMSALLFTAAESRCIGYGKRSQKQGLEAAAVKGRVTYCSCTLTQFRAEYEQEAAIGQAGSKMDEG
jgi:hypothetical protein